jgi:hypothetical protein
MSNQSWFANSAQLQVTIGATAASVAALRNVRFVPRYEHAELYGIESTHRKAVCKYQYSVDVTCEYAMWDPSTDYILSSFINGAYLAPPCDTTTATDADTACYRSKVALFTITGTVYDTSCGTTMTATAYNVYFPEVPAIDLTENGYMSRNLSGKAESFAYMYKDV